MRRRPNAFPARRQAAVGDSISAQMFLTFLFAAIWIGAGVGILVFALRKGRPAATGPATPASRSRLFVVMAVLYVGVGLAIPLASIVGSSNAKEVRSEGIKLTEEQKKGRELFGGLCGSCHRLQSADAVGRTGPNLDMQLAAQPAADAAAAQKVYDGRKDYVYTTIINGLQRGNGTMPALVAQGQQAQQISAFVAATAGYNNP